MCSPHSTQTTVTDIDCSLLPLHITTPPRGASAEQRVSVINLGTHGECRGLQYNLKTSTRHPNLCRSGALRRDVQLYTLFLPRLLCANTTSSHCWWCVGPSPLKVVENIIPHLQSKQSHCLQYKPLPVLEMQSSIVSSEVM